MKNRLNICNIFTLLFCLYYLQGTLYAEGGTIGKLLLAILIILSFYYMFVVFSKYKVSPYLKGTGIIILLFSIYGFIRIIGGNAEFFRARVYILSYNFIKNVYLSILPVFSYYYFTKQGLITEKWLKNWFWGFLFVAIMGFIKANNTIHQNSQFENITNNDAYNFVALMPIVYLFRKKPLLQYAILLFLLIMTIYGMKRGAILIGLIVAVLFVLHSTKKAKGGNRLSIILLVVGISIGVYFYVMYLFQNNDYFYFRYEQTMSGNSSNRDNLYSQLWNIFFHQQDASKFLLGRGLDATALLVGTPAHQDWAEIAIDMGLLGLLVYLMYWFSFIRSWRLIRKNDVIHFILGLIILSSFVKSLFSFYVNNNIFYVSCFVSYCIANTNKNT